MSRTTKLTMLRQKKISFLVEMLALNEKAEILLLFKAPLLTEEIMKGSLTCLWMNSTNNKELSIPTPANSWHLIIPLCHRPDSLSKKCNKYMLFTEVSRQRAQFFPIRPNQGR